MREKIIVTNELNKNEILKSIATFGGKSFNVRVMSVIDLAKHVLMCSGITNPFSFLTRSEAIALVADILVDIPYFKNANYKDSANIVSALNSVRMLITEREAETMDTIFMKSEFKEKNQAMLEVFHKYIEVCAEQKLMDSVMLLRYVLEQGKYIDADFQVIKEFPLAPLETELVKKASNSTDQKLCYKEITVSDLFGVKADQVKVVAYVNNYGIPNEVDTIFNKIYDANFALDQCIVAACDVNSYAQSFFEMALVYDIPVTFGTGISINNSNPGKLLNLYYHWKTDGYFGIDALKKMILSSSFDLKKLKSEIDENVNFYMLLDKCGRLRLCDNLEKNKQLLDEIGEGFDKETPFAKGLQAVAIMLSLPVEEFIAKYSRIRFGYIAEENITSYGARLTKKLDLSAVQVIAREMIAIKNTNAISSTEIIPQILGKNICKEASKEGHLHLTTVQGAFSVVRKYLFVAGLSARIFPGAPKENYLVLDKEYKLFEGGERYISNERILYKRDLLIELVKMYSALECQIRVSYAGLNVSDLKNENASSVLFEMYRMEHGENTTMQELEEEIYKVDYFTPAISNNRVVGRLYVNDYTVVPCEKQKKQEEQKISKINLKEEEYSPSAIDMYFQCPKRFMLKYILKVSEPEHYDNLQTISAADEGILAHATMQEIANKNVTLEQFLDVAKDKFDEFLKHNPSLISSDGEDARNQFLELMTTAYDLRPLGKVVVVEETIKCVHKETKVHLYGIPDCIMKLEDSDEYVVIDYKTGYEIKHFTDNIRSFLQLVLYAYMLEQSGKKVNHLEVRYLRNNQIIYCKYDDSIKESLAELLTQFRLSLVENNYACDEKKEGYCDYCSYGLIC